MRQALNNFLHKHLPKFEHNDKIGQRHEHLGVGNRVEQRRRVSNPPPLGSRDFQHYVSSAILYELIRVLREVFSFPDDLLYDWYWLLLAGSVYVVPTTRVDAVRDDPDDNKFLACAIDGGADFVVSEDKDPLRIGSYESVQIVRKQVFLLLLESATDD